MRRTGRPSARQVLACRQAVRSTQAPMECIRPVSSATGRNSALLTTPSSPLVQHSSASIPETLAVRTSNCGWYRSESSLRARAPRKRSSLVKRCSAIAFMDAIALHRFTIEDRLRGALARNELSLLYQPQFDVRTASISGMEVLLRWTSAELGVVSSAEFLPVAEETGLILPIGAWVLRTACLQAKTWRAEGLPVQRIAVNVSGRQFALADYPAQVATILRETGIDPALLELEISESVVMADEAWAERTINQLKQLGVSLALDDFGIGYSRFGRLRNLAVDRLKIGRPFVTSITEGGDDRAIASAIIAMSRSLHINVIAEGVENFPQLAFLQEQDCQDAQGFLLSRPLQAEEAQALLKRSGELGEGSRSQRFKALIG